MTDTIDTNCTFLGFDYGEQRIGVATGQLTSRLASPCTTLNAVNGKPDWQAIENLIDEWRPGAFVVGIPIHMDGSDTRITDKAKRFARQLNGRFGLPAYHADERLSSVAANELIKSARQSGQRGKTRKGDDDRIAAALILQDWLDMYDANS